MASKSKKAAVGTGDFQPIPGQPIYLDGETIGTVQTVAVEGNGYRIGVNLFDPEKHGEYTTVKTSGDVVYAEVEAVQEDEPEQVFADGPAASAVEAKDAEAREARGDAGSVPTKSASSKTEPRGSN